MNWDSIIDAITPRRRNAQGEEEGSKEGEAMTSAKLTQAGHTLCVDRVRIPQFGQPGTPGQWIWWVCHPNGKMSGEEHTLCFDPLDDSELRKAHSAAAHHLELAKIQGALEFDELEWAP